MADENIAAQFDFDAYFRNLLVKAYDKESRMLKLDFTIPEHYERDMKSFSQKFFSENPFELTGEDLEEFLEHRIYLCQTT